MDHIQTSLGPNINATNAGRKTCKYLNIFDISSLIVFNELKLLRINEKKRIK